MKKIFTISLISVFFVIISPGTLFAVCLTPDFPTSFNYNGYTEDTLAETIENKPGYAEDWCSASKLCPSEGVVKSNGECSDVSADLKQKWSVIIGSVATAKFFNSETVAGVTTKGLYYTKSMCKICSVANGTANGADATVTNPPPGGGAQPPAATPGNPTSVAVIGFDKLDNPLGPANLTTVSDVIERALGIIIKISIPFVVLMLIWTGFQFVIAQGNSDKISKAKNTLLWVIVGAAILIGCVSIAKAIANSVETVAKAASGN